MKRISDAKADIIESAINNPSIPPEAASLDAALMPLAMEYRRAGNSREDILELSNVANLPAEEGCRVATAFTDALARLDEKQSVLAYKSILMRADAAGRQ